MSKLFKNSKQIMAVVMAFAILAVSLFAGSIVASAESTESLCVGTRIEYWDGTASNSFTKGAGTADNPYIIENAKQLNWVCTASDVASEGKYYKVDPEIKAFILQPQSIVTALGGDDAFINVASAAETKELFEVKAAGQQLKNWLANGNSKVFAGNFDGNGVAIYGCYADDALRGTQQCALFPILDGNGVGLPDEGATETPTVIKNFALRNSYFKGGRRVAAISSTAWWAKGGTKINGFIEAEYIELANCFLVGQDLLTKDGSIHTWNATSRNAEMAVAFGSMGNDAVKADHLSIYGNDAEYRMYGAANATTYAVEATMGFDRFASDNRQGTTNANYGELHNSIVLGTAVSGLNTNNADVTYVSNVYTDVKTTLKGVTVVENGFGDEGQAAMTELDWDTDWFMGQYGPIFRSFHGKFSLVKTNTTHYTACEDCGYKSYGGEVEHNWNDTYACTVCGWQCEHGSQTVGEFREGDCVTKDGYYTECHYCTWGSVEYVGTVDGHKLTWVDEILADCENTGREGYYHCSVCNGNFQADSDEAAKWASMDTNILDPETELLTPIAPHNATNREDGSILVVQDGNNGHYWICYTCDGRLLAVEKDKYAEEGQIKKHKYEDGVCVDCGWECPEHNYQPTGIVAVPGTCEIDREEELKCTNCGDKKTKVTPAAHKIVKFDEIPANDKLEGTKAHYECTQCKEIYLDAEGKTKATAASLVIPKVLPKEYQNQIQGNIDTSDKSPSTGDSVASVLAVAAFAGAAFVMARKIKR